VTSGYIICENMKTGDRTDLLDRQRVGHREQHDVVVDELAALLQGEVDQLGDRAEAFLDVRDGDEFALDPDRLRGALQEPQPAWRSCRRRR
jgi:hypothetical protein